MSLRNFPGHGGADGAPPCQVALADTGPRLTVGQAAAAGGGPGVAARRRTTRYAPGPQVDLIATSRIIRVWNSLAEINGRTIMRDGQWAPA